MRFREAPLAGVWVVSPERVEDERGHFARTFDREEWERRGMDPAVVQDKRQILEFLLGLKRDGLRIVGYGAPAKGNTLLNYCGIRTDFVEYTCDLSPHKQGHLLPGTHIPIRSPDALREDRPDVVLILPWNLRDEIMEQLSFIREWGGRFAVRSPELQIVS